MTLVSILLFLSMVLALPAWRREATLLNFSRATGLAFAIWIAPLFVFFFSAFMLPDWKGECRHGWIDCFHLGKLALTPLVLWATTSLYAVEVLKVEHRTSPFMVLGLLTGALVSGGCLAVGIYIQDSRFNGPGLFMVVPAYVFGWYAGRTIQLLREARTSILACITAVSGSLPFWVASMWWAQKTYAALPDQAPQGCFVVTAAGRGHESIVGPFVEITRRGQLRRVNRQLVTFWDLERGWQRRAPRSHALFRRGYNRLGPVLARGVAASPWLADATFLALKPAEWLAALWLRKVKNLSH